MPTTYYLGSATEADPTGVYNWEKVLLTTPTGSILGTSANITSSTSQALRSLRWLEAAGSPVGAAGGSGARTFSVEMNVGTANTNVTGTCFIGRISSGGVQQSRVQIGGSLTMSAGVKLWSGSVDIGTFVAGDRFYVEVLLATTSTMSQAVGVSMNTTSNEVIAPWSTPPVFTNLRSEVVTDSGWAARGTYDPKGSFLDAAFEVRLQGSPTWAQEVTTSYSNSISNFDFPITGKSAGTVYEWRIRSTNMDIPTEVWYSNVQTVTTSAPPVLLTADVADTLTLSDAVVDQHGMFRSVSPADTLSVSDTTDTATGKTATAADTLALSDAQSLQNTIGRLVADTLPLADAQSFQRFMDRLVADTVGVADTQSLESTIERIVTDTLSVADAQSFQRAIDRLVADTLTLSDAQSLQNTIGQIVVDTLPLADAQSFQRAVDRLVADTLVVADAQAVQRDIFQSPSDALTVNDAASAQSGKSVAVDDALGVDIVANPRFEVDTSAWALGTESVGGTLSRVAGSDVGTPWAGYYLESVPNGQTLALVARPSGSPYVSTANPLQYMTAPAAAGQSWSMAATVRQGGTHAFHLWSPNGIRCRISFYNSGGGLLSSAESSVASPGAQTLSVSANAPAGTASVQAAIVTFNGSGGTLSTEAAVSDVHLSSGLADSVVRAAGTNVPFTDSLTVADGSVTQSNIARTTSDALTLSDALAFVRSMQHSHADALVVTDAALTALSAALEAQVNDVLVLTDTTGVGVVRSIVDALSVSDTVLTRWSGEYRHFDPPLDATIDPNETGGLVFVVVADGTVTVIDAAGVVAQVETTGTATQPPELGAIAQDNATSGIPRDNTTSGTD